MSQLTIFENFLRFYMHVDSNMEIFLNSNGKLLDLPSSALPLVRCSLMQIVQTLMRDIGIILVGVTKLLANEPKIALQNSKNLFKLF